MFAAIRAISFDCYGTLIDWQTGIRAALAPALAGRVLDDDALFDRYAQLERRAEQPPYKSYKAVLEEVAADLLGPSPDADPALLWKSLPAWPAFDETPAALRALQGRFRLAIVSNIDDDLFAHSRPKLGVELDEVVTAEQVRSYKPALPHFHELLRRLDLPPSQVLHVAESRYHDIVPANDLGMPCIWINRARGRASASGRGAGRPTMTVESLTDLLAQIRP